jgi:hypothetical protein
MKAIDVTIRAEAIIFASYYLINIVNLIVTQKVMMSHFIISVRMRRWNS